MTLLHTPWFANARTGFFIAKQAARISQETALDYCRSPSYFAERLRNRFE